MNQDSFGDDFATPARATTRNRDLVLIRSLCGLGLPAQTLAPPLLSALRKLIPSHSAAVFWVDSGSEIVGMYAERLLPPEALARCHKHFRQDIATNFAVRAAAPDPVSARSFAKSEQASAFFRDVMLPLDAYQILAGILRDGTRPLGQISIYRGAQDPKFNCRDQTALRGVLRYLSAGLRPLPPATEPDALGGIAEEWLGLVDFDGAVVSAPADWSRLVRLLAMGEVTPRKAHEEHLAVRAFIRRICAQLTDTDGEALDFVESQKVSQWGNFRIRAYRMPFTTDHRHDRVGLLIGRREPRVLALVRGSGASGLSPQQSEVALLVAKGKSNQEIARGLSLTLNTASYHVKQVFARLAVRNRNDVEKVLLRLAEEESTLPRQRCREGLESVI